MLKHPILKASLCATGLLAAASPGLAFQLDWGEVQGSFDTIASLGAAMRVEERDSALVGIANGGTRRSVNADDGNLNYDKGDFTTVAAKLTSDLSLQYKNFGLFVRGTYLYDFVNSDEDQFAAGGKRQAAREAVADEIGNKAELLDAYVSAEFKIGDRNLGVKLGNQILSWGEGSVIPGGINVNPFDVAKLRIPGAELREVQRPVPMLWGILDLTDNAAVEGFYQLDWEETKPDPAGSYFSTNDGGGIGGEIFMLGFGSAAEFTPGATLFRQPDREPDDQGQFGIALTYFAQWLNDTEFRFYGMNYHSRVPLISGFGASTSPADPLVNDNKLNGSYFQEYPEDVRLYGVSFNTQALGWSVAGEYSYRDGIPLRLDDVELLYAALGLDSQICGAGDPEVNNDVICPAAGSFAGSRSYVQGFRRHNQSQAQMTFINQFGAGNPAFADQLLLLIEVGANYVHDLPDKDELRYESEGTDTSGGPSFADGHPLNPDSEPAKNFADDFSWGYRIITQATYFNALGPFSLKPRFVFFHDVKGNTPGPGGAFVDGRISMNIGITAEHANGVSFDISHARFQGGGERNLISDRDLVAANIKYKF